MGFHLMYSAFAILHPPSAIRHSIIHLTQRTGRLQGVKHEPQAQTSEFCKNSEVWVHARSTQE